MPKCSKCGADVKAGNAFCSHCGTKVERQASPQPKPQQSQPQQTQTQSQQPATQTAIPKKKKSVGVKILIGCLIAFVVFAIAGGVAAYFLVKKGIEKAQDEINRAEEEWQKEADEWEKMGNEFKEEAEEKADELKDEAEENLDDSTSTKTKKDKPTKKASKVVEEFMACTLGTIPQKCPSDDKDSVAKDHLTLEMRADYNSDTFIPFTYCIQMGPDNVRIDSEIENGGFTYVKVSAKYGTDDYYPMWNFILVIQDGEWKIKEIQCLSYDVQ